MKFIDAYELKHIYLKSCDFWRKQNIKDKFLTSPATDSYNENPLEILDELSGTITEVNGPWTDVVSQAQEADTDFDYYEELFDNRAQHEILFPEQPAPAECTEKPNDSIPKDSDTGDPPPITTAKKGPTSKKDRQTISKNREKTSNETTNILCDHCNKTFPNQRSYHRHQNYNQLLKTKCPLCTKEFAHKSNLKRHLTTHKDQKLVCEKCDRQFTDHTLLYEHMKTHRFDEHLISNLDDYVIGCELCTKLRTTSFAVYTNHMRTEHGFQSVDRCKPFICRICSLKFASKQGMLRHIDNIHENNRRNLRNRDKNYLCTICGKKFYTNFHLEVHARSHSGEKPFGCSVCGKKFSQASPG
jgi:Zinc finger, C2H2 type